MMRAPPDLAIVYWLDAKVPAQGGWEDLATVMPLLPLQCVSAGFVQAEDDQSIVLLQTMGETELQGRIVIPRGAVEKVVRFKSARRRHG